MPRTSKYKANIIVENNSTNFSELFVGDMFAKNDAIIGFGDLWMGFDIFIKVSCTTAVNKISGRTIEFDTSFKVLEINFDTIDHPISKKDA